jgi:hypothetical protein
MLAAFAVNLGLEKEIGIFVECGNAARWQWINSFELAEACSWPLVIRKEAIVAVPSSSFTSKLT